jgi:hypothetical protein
MKNNTGKQHRPCSTKTWNSCLKDRQPGRNKQGMQKDEGTVKFLTFI